MGKSETCFSKRGMAFGNLPFKRPIVEGKSKGMRNFTPLLFKKRMKGIFETLPFKRQIVGNFEDFAF